MTLDKRSFARLFPGFTDDSAQQATLSVGHPGMEYNKSADVARPAHLRALIVVRDKIRRDLPKINRCYESALRYEPQLAGKVKVRFAIIRNGDVKAVRVLENTTGHEGVERCVARVLGGIQFPSRKSGKSLSFTFPFVFAPQGP